MLRTLLASLLLLGLYCGCALGRASLEDRRNSIEVANGTTIHRTENGFNVTDHRGGFHFYPAHNHSEAPAQKRDSGWITSLWGYGTSFTYFTARWFVPPTPATNEGQVLFFFNSLESTGGNEILQPVLQYNNIISGWSLAAWYGGPAGYFHSTPVAVHSGDSIIGYIYQSGSTWVVLGYVNSVLVAEITVSTSTISSIQPYAQLTLEVYYVTECSAYPPSDYITFEYITIVDSGEIVSPYWYPDVYANSCAAYALNSPVPTLEWDSFY